MFLGDHVCVMEGSSYVKLPARFREALTGRVFITQGFERNLLVMPSGIFEELYRQLSRLNAADPLSRLFTRLFLGSAAEITLDEQGGLRIPEALRAFAQLEDETIVVGQGNFFELWAPAQWTTQTAELQNVEANTQRFAGFNLVISH